MLKNYIFNQKIKFTFNKILLIMILFFLTFNPTMMFSKKLGELWFREVSNGSIDKDLMEEVFKNRRNNLGSYIVENFTKFSYWSRWYDYETD